MTSPTFLVLWNRWEAAQCPKVKVAKIDPQKLMVEQTPYMPSIPSVQPCASHLLPSKEWETEFLVDFSNLRTVSLRSQVSFLSSCAEHAVLSIWYHFCQHLMNPQKLVQVFAKFWVTCTCPSLSPFFHEICS